MSREYFLAYFDYLDAISELSDAEVGRLFKATLKYGQSGKAPKLCGNEKFAFGFIKKQIDRDNEKYEQKCETNRKNGALGGKTKSERQILADGSERSLDLAFAPKKKEKEKKKTNVKERTTNVVPKKTAHGEFQNVLLSDDELSKLKAQFSDYKYKIQNLSSYIASSGKKYQSHYATILTWDRKDIANGTNNQKHTPKARCTEYDE